MYFLRFPTFISLSLSIFLQFSHIHFFLYLPSYFSLSLLLPLSIYLSIYISFLSVKKFIRIKCNFNTFQTIIDFVEDQKSGLPSVTSLRNRFSGQTPFNNKDDQKIDPKNPPNSAFKKESLSRNDISHKDKKAKEKRDASLKRLMVKKQPSDEDLDDGCFTGKFSIFKKKLDLIFLVGKGHVKIN